MCIRDSCVPAGSSSSSTPARSAAVVVVACGAGVETRGAGPRPGFRHSAAQPTQLLSALASVHASAQTAALPCTLSALHQDNAALLLLSNPTRFHHTNRRTASRTQHPSSTERKRRVGRKVGRPPAAAEQHAEHG
eukprot:672446-Rhodomonas_salina.3